MKPSSEHFVDLEETLRTLPRPAVPEELTRRVLDEVRRREAGRRRAERVGIERVYEPRPMPGIGSGRTATLLGMVGAVIVAGTQAVVLLAVDVRLGLPASAFGALPAWMERLPAEPTAAEPGAAALFLGLGMLLYLVGLMGGMFRDSDPAGSSHA